MLYSLLLLVLAAQARPSEAELVTDAHLDCPHALEGAADLSKCERKQGPGPEGTTTWSFKLSPPGKLFLSIHQPDVPWKTVNVVPVDRSMEPALVTVGVVDDAQLCPDKKLQVLFVQAQGTTRADMRCVEIDWTPEQRLLVGRHPDLPIQRWFPLWVAQRTGEGEHAPKDGALLQGYISKDRSVPETPELHPYGDWMGVAKATPPPPPPIEELLPKLDEAGEPVLDEEGEPMMLLKQTNAFGVVTIGPAPRPEPEEEPEDEASADTPG